MQVTKIWNDILKLIEKEFDLNVTKIKKMGEGLESEAFLVNDTYIFKHSKHSEAFKSLAREVEVLNYLEEQKGSTPKLLYTNALRRFGRVDGTAIYQILKKVVWTWGSNLEPQRGGEEWYNDLYIGL